MGNRWLCVQWNIDINESAEIKVLFSEFYSPHNFKLHIYINNFWSSNSDVYLLSSESRWILFGRTNIIKSVLLRYSCVSIVYRATYLSKDCEELNAV